MFLIPDTVHQRPGLSLFHRGNASGGLDSSSVSFGEWLCVDVDWKIALLEWQPRWTKPQIAVVQK